MNEQIPERYLKAAEAERQSGHSQAKLYRLARLGELTVLRHGRTVRFPERALQAWIAAHTTTAKV